MPLLAKLKKAFVPPDPKAALNAPPGVTRTKVWFDVSIGNAEPGRIEMGACLGSGDEGVLGGG